MYHPSKAILLKQQVPGVKESCFVLCCSQTEHSLFQTFACFKSILLSCNYFALTRSCTVYNIPVNVYLWPSLNAHNVCFFVYWRLIAPPTAQGHLRALNAHKAPTKYSNLASRYFLMVSRVSGTALCRKVLRSEIMGLRVFSMRMANLSMLRWASPNIVKASLAAGWGSLTPMEAKTSPKAIKVIRKTQWTVESVPLNNNNKLTGGTNMVR